MKYREFIKCVRRTESNDFAKIVNRFVDADMIRLLHAALGICTEAAEFLDIIKKHLFYGKKVDRANIVEELGDLFWYIAIASDVLGVPFNTIMTKNIEKLQARYPEKFDEFSALNRNLDVERKILEGDSNDDM